MKSKAWTEKFMQGVFLIAACTSVLAVALICIFLFANGVPAIREIGFVKFITGELWRPNNNLFGIFPMIIGSLYVTAGAIVFGVPIGILTSVFMAMYCPKKIYRPLKAATELLAGIPSVVYGFFGLVVLVPMVREFGRTLKQMGIVEKAGDGKGLLTTSIILGMMILPTIIGTTESAIRAAGEPESCGKSRCRCEQYSSGSLCGERNRSIQYTRSQCKWCERTRNCRNASGSP